MHSDEFIQCPNCRLDITVDVVICFDCGFDIAQGFPKRQTSVAKSVVDNDNNAQNIIITDSPPTPRPNTSIIKCEGIECDLCDAPSHILYSNIDDSANEYCEECYNVLNKN